MKDNLKIRDKMAKYAYSSSIFYKKQIDYKEVETEDFNFEKLPYITKEMFVESRLPIETMEYIVNRDEKNVITLITSGSTGKCLSVDWNKEDYIKSMMPLWIMRKRYYGINVFDKMCYFYTLHNIGKEERLERENNNTLGFSKTLLSEERLIKIYERMSEYNPIWLLLQPSIASMLLDIAKKYKLSPLSELKYIEL